MQIPLVVLLFLYTLAVVAFLAFFISHIYHMARYSFWNASGYIITSLLVLISLGTLIISAIFMKTVDWNIPWTFPIVEIPKTLE